MTVWVGWDFSLGSLKPDMCRDLRGNTNTRCCAQWAHSVTLNSGQWTVGQTYLHWAMENNWNSEISYLALGSCCSCLFCGFWKTQQQPVLTHGDPQKHVQWKCA